MRKIKIELKNHISFIAILLIANFQTVFGQNFLVEKDLRLDWVYYDDGEKLMLPFLENSNEDPVAIHLFIDSNHGKGAYLMIDIPENTSLLLGNKFMRHYDEHIIRYFSLDSLSTISEPGDIQLTLYNKKSFENPWNAKIGFIHKTFDSTMNINPIEERNVDKRSEYLKIVILALFTFFVILHKFFPAEFLAFLSLQTLITFRYTTTAIANYRSLTKIQTLVIIYQAALLSGILIFFLNYYNNPIDQIFFLRINPIFGWLFLFGIILFLMLLKYILISIISFLFGLADRINFYFIEFLRMAMVFYSVLFVILSYTIINHFYLVDALLESLIVAVILFNLIRFVILYFKFRRTTSLKSLHLISYLCTTELIPIVIGLKFFLK